jgi:hypothetical protein
MFDDVSKWQEKFVSKMHELENLSQPKIDGETFLILAAY